MSFLFKVTSIIISVNNINSLFLLYINDKNVSVMYYFAMILYIANPFYKRLNGV